ncbi:sec-independent translocase [Streptomyces sp. HB132]|uniref:sec-independent translocase n=1 Tax=Streptomyces sp. HB132 TaxID=767388 RepID=UPI001960A9C7|nr:sec-independent translocase [Streptomyces sp. HB132]MBM7442237.1 sec-independent protein translocase protein TatB [Streptomyces sp. HB132]
MFADVGFLELVTLVVLALVLFGPDKLPQAIRTVSGFVRKFREFSESAKQEVRTGLGPDFEDFEFEDLDPRAFVRKHVLSDDGPGLDAVRDALDPRPELDEVMRAVREAAGAEPVRDSPAAPSAPPRPEGDRVSPRKGGVAAGRPPFDPDAT